MNIDDIKSELPKFAQCPNCKRNGRDNIAIGVKEVDREFGYKEIADGSIQVQSWCRECRAEHYRIGHLKRMNMKKEGDIEERIPIKKEMNPVTKELQRIVKRKKDE